MGYVDPPFNSNKNYSAPVGSDAAGAAFKDTWTLSDVDLAWHGEIAEKEPALYQVIDAAGMSHGKGMKSYLIMMTVRLLEMKRILKPTGSIYLHCDDTASHYLKALMDSVFDKDNFQNEIVWQRTTSRSSGKKFGRVNDKLLFYTLGKKYTYNAQYQPLSSGGLAPYRYVDEDGEKYTLDNVAAPGNNGYFYDFGVGEKTPARGYRMPWKTAQEMLANNTLVVKAGSVPRRKRYLKDSKGAKVNDVITDIKVLSSHSKERTGYPTQKPLALLERIIKASSNEGDVVFDPFCGCATTLVAAEKLNRKWAGIDLSPVAANLIRQRLKEIVDVEIIVRTDTPRLHDGKKLPHYRTHKHTLFGKQEGHCNGCKVSFPFRNMTVDHVIPQVEGGSHHVDNLQLLCGACNSTKGKRSQEYLIVKLKENKII